MSTAQLQQIDVTGLAVPAPSPVKIIETLLAYQRTAALKAAIEIDLFTAVGDGRKTVPELARYCAASERGIRALCDFVVTMGFLAKTDHTYHLTSESAVFLDKHSERYVGSASRFLGSPVVTKGFDDLTAIVRSGGPLVHEPFSHTENPMWVEFAQSMAPLTTVIARQTEQLVRSSSEIKVLDVAAGHGLFGIFVARHNPKARVVALDWPSVLNVAKENAEHFKVNDRFSLLPGDAREVELGNGFDLVMIPNLLHQWDKSTIARFLAKVHSALAPGGRVVLVELAPNDDRVTPPVAGAFVLNMLVNTIGGDAYSLSEYSDMLRKAGFSEVSHHPLAVAPHTVIFGSRS